MNDLSANIKEVLGVAVTGYIVALFAVPAAFLGFIGFGSLLTFLTDCCVLPATIKPAIIPLAGACVAGFPTILYSARRRFRKIA
ncbi:MAG: hypothetical protein R6U44_06450 [Archaeoglobaceae archaeon]